MKKLFAAVVLMISVLALISCSDRQSLDGDYYWISDITNELAFSINDGKGNLHIGESDGFTVDEKDGTFKLFGSQVVDHTARYTYKDGVLSVDVTGSKGEYYKKGTQAYKDALKKFGQEEKE